MTDTQAFDITAQDGTSYSSQELLDNYGVVTSADGQNVYLIAEPYLAGTFDNPSYISIGIDMAGNYYRIVWSILPVYEGSTDESDRCDWHAPKSVTSI